MPLKRHTSIQPLSRDHHKALLLCFKIRQGFAKKIDPARIKKYADWFFTHHLVPHFEVEEKYLFPVLGNTHEHVQQALAEHRELENLFNNENDVSSALSDIENKLEQHIRFEERILFNEIQEIATPQQLELIEKHHHEEGFVENVEDSFWV